MMAIAQVTFIFAISVVGTIRPYFHTTIHILIVFICVLQAAHSSTPLVPHQPEAPTKWRSAVLVWRRANVELIVSKLTFPFLVSFQFKTLPNIGSSYHKISCKIIADSCSGNSICSIPDMFNIYTREAGPGSLSVSVEGPAKAKLDVQDRGHGYTTVSYKVDSPGTQHRLHIEINQ